MKLPENFKLAPSKVAKQIEVPQNCYFHVSHRILYVYIIKIIFLY